MQPLYPLKFHYKSFGCNSRIMVREEHSGVPGQLGLILRFSAGAGNPGVKAHFKMELFFTGLKLNFTSNHWDSPETLSTEFLPSREGPEHMSKMIIFCEYFETLGYCRNGELNP